MMLATTQLEETIRREMERNRIPGIAIALIRSDEIVFTEGYGVTSTDGGEPVTPETRFAIMSVTKPIVVSAMMQLRDAGHFQLDDPANKHLAPASSIANQFEDEAPVTIRQLMTHSGGLPVAIAASAPQKLSLAEYVKTFARTTHRPGTEIIYANLGFDAIGVLIESFSGQRVDDYLRDHVFRPLGMTASELANPAEGEPRTTGHYLSAVDGAIHTLPLPEWPTIPASPAGGCWSNVLDVAKFLIAHLNGGSPILDARTAAEMHDLHFRQSEGNGQGLGFRVTRANDRRLICHGGDGGGFTAFAAAHPEERVGVVLLQNGGGMQSARSVIGTAALRALAPTPKIGHGPEPTPPEPGVYKSTFWDIELEARGDTLTPTSGLVLLGEQPPSRLMLNGDYFDAEGGMLDGFEVTVEADRIYGGVYPFTFVRTSDLPTAPPPIDETLDLTGDWSGHIQTPLGPIRTSLHIISETAITADTPFAQGVAVQNARATAGRVEGDFTLNTPVGEMQMILRLEARGGKLTGVTHGRAVFGETPFMTGLARA